jgi:hypothetical protein
MLAAARAGGGEDHGFSILQLPANLLEPDAIFVRKEGEDGDRSVLDLASDAGIAVLVNRPLNAFVGGRLVRLADVTAGEPEVDFQEQLERVADLELAFGTDIAPQLQAAPDTLDPAEYFQLAGRLKGLQPNVTDVAHWSQVEAQLNLAVMTIVGVLNRQLEGEVRDRWIEWRDSYMPELEELMRELRRQAAEKTHNRSSAIAAAIDPLLPAERRRESLSSKALWILKSTRGVTCVLNGMRRSEYVDDATGVLAWDDLESVERIYAAAGWSSESSPER